MNFTKVIFLFLFIIFFYGYTVYVNKKKHIPPCNVIYIHHDENMSTSPFPDGSNFHEMDKFDKLDK